MQVILEDCVIVTGDSIQPIAFCNFNNRAHPWQDCISASDPLLPSPCHNQEPETLPGMTTGGSHVHNLPLRLSGASISIYLEVSEIFNFLSDKWSYSASSAYCNWSNCSHFLRELGGSGGGLILHFVRFIDYRGLWMKKVGSWVFIKMGIALNFVGASLL